MHAEIAGGGIGALATATALCQRGWTVRVHERQSRVQDVGAGIYIWGNGLRVLDALGAYDDAVRGTHRGSVFETRDAQNAVIERTVFPDNVRLYTIPRDQLLKALLDAARKAGAEVITSSEVAGASEDGHLEMMDGRRLGADLVIGIDGVASRVREALGLGLVHDRTPEGAIRLMIPAGPLDITAPGGSSYIENWSGTRRLLVTPVSPTQIYLALTCIDGDTAWQRVPVDVGLWKQAFPAWGHYLDRIKNQGHWGVYSVIKTKAWSRGRAAILGDAAHAQTPNLGQGGGMAMQNGLALAVALESVKHSKDIPHALRDWERKERPVTEHCQKWASLYGELAHLPDDLRAAILRQIGSTPWVTQQLLSTANHVPTGTLSL
jgi:2-polyprenyl-6-methoxyphenol hydroxylase-like FAD-dependent oxidoreductase